MENANDSYSGGVKVVCDSKYDRQIQSHLKGQHCVSIFEFSHLMNFLHIDVFSAVTEGLSAIQLKMAYLA